MFNIQNKLDIIIKTKHSSKNKKYIDNCELLNNHY